MNEAIVLEIIKQLLVYGPGILDKIVKIKNEKKDLTVDDIRALKINKKPEEYFE